MKVQLQPGCLRLRLGMAEFEALQGGRAIDLTLRFQAGAAWSIRIEAGTTFAMHVVDGVVCCRFPSAALDELASRLPSRQGLTCTSVGMGEQITVLLDVDVHDRAGKAARSSTKP